ncbi:MAG: TonB-dependent receptor [Acidobacteriota bacterium]
MFKKVNILATFLAFFILFVTTAFTQVTAGRVTGSVLDANGAAISGGTVTLKSETTGLALTTQTTGAGSFLFPNVLPGAYKITIENTGFQSVSQDITVALNQESAVNVKLQVGGTGTNVVDVTAASEALVQTESSQLGRSFQTQQVQNLPIFGNQNALALLSPNVVGQSAGTAGSGGTVGGVRPRYNIFTVDGIENNDPSVTGPSTSVIQDAVEEFTLLTNNFNAEFGQGGGGQFVTITRSGTNQFHGSGFVYLQHQKLNAASTSEERALQNGEITELPRLRDVRYGLTFGGPIVRDKLFFFGAVERHPYSAEGSSSTFLAPTSSGLAQIATLPGASPFVVNLLRNNLTLAESQTTTQNVLGTPIGFGNVSVIIPSTSQDNQYQLNIDYNANERNQFRFRYSHDDFVGVGVGNGGPAFNNDNVFKSRLFSATYVRAFSSSLVNELRLSYRRAASDAPLQNGALNDFPNITVATLNLSLGPNENLPQSGGDNSYQVFDTLSYTRGAHSFKFGADVRDVLTSSFFLPRGRGDYVYTNFDELIQDRAPTNVDLRGVGSGSFVGTNQHYYFFGQDDWKVTPNLTLNLGLRYEYVTLPRDSKLQTLNSLASIPGVLEFRVPKTDKNNFAPRVGFAYSPSFGGRIGHFLFGENRASSIRGNFSTSYTEVFQNLILLQLPPQLQQESDVASAEAAFGLNLHTNFLQQGGIPPDLIPQTETVASARAGTGSFITDQRFGEIYAFALSYQRALTSKLALEVRYLGTRSRHLPVQLRRNGGTTNRAALTIPTFLSTPTAAQLAGLTTLGDIKARPDVTVFPLDAFTAPDEQFGGFVTSFEPVGNSNYDSGSVSLTSRVSRGLSFTTAYTFSKTLSNSDNELFTSRVNPRRPEDIFNLSRENSLSTFDIPHRFVFAGNFAPTLFNSKGGALKGLLGGWILAPIFQAQSGQPFTPNAGIDSNLDFDSAGDRTILNQNGVAGTGSAVYGVNAAGQVVRNSSGVAVISGSAANTIVAYVADGRRIDQSGNPIQISTNPNAQYIQTGPGASSTAGRNTLRSRGFNRTDLSILKNFRFGEESYNLQIGTEIFNLFNQRITTIGGVGATTSAFSNVNSPLFNDYSIGNFSGRTIQFRAKFIF